MDDEAETNKERSRRRYEEVFSKGNYAVADDLMAADIVGSPAMSRAGGAGYCDRHASERS